MQLLGSNHSDMRTRIYRLKIYFLMMTSTYKSLILTVCWKLGRRLKVQLHRITALSAQRLASIGGFSDIMAIEWSRLRLDHGSLLYLMIRGHKAEEWGEGVDSGLIVMCRFQLLELPSLGCGQLGLDCPAMLVQQV